MKKFLGLILILGFIGCAPVMEVNVHTRHPFYEWRRPYYYTAPVWIPGRGVILQDHYIPRKSRQIPGRKGRN